ncbi:MAG TPA: thioesterase family protein [Ferrovibrio sp.]|jgi:YbgC/YbaW family acyl-CoA thioester hydrolase|uniref:acyl-CoA thioesterase n=1 Tax=Ferrovibrio sp. TaxID=1917215 RepID=UPI002ED45088
MSAPPNPYTVRRIVKWGECDPAGIVYTPRFLDWVLEAAESFFAEVVGVDWFQLNQKYGLGSPSVSVKLDFRKPIQFGQPFTIEVLVRRLSRSTITYAMRGRNGAHELCFEAELVSCIVNHAQMKSVAIPDDIRQPILAYQAATAAVLEKDAAA